MYPLVLQVAIKAADFHYSCGSCMGVCGLHKTVAELDQSSVSAIVATRVGTDYIALIMITILMTQSM